MKPEVYSCLKMLEAFQNRMIQIWNTKSFGVAENLRIQYNDIRKLLLKHLDTNQIAFIPTVEGRYLFSDESFMILLNELISAADIAISYLRSLDMDLDKELQSKKEDLAKKEKELGLKETEIESLRKLLKDSLEAIKQYPELQRSRTVEEIKKSHRKIENSSRKIT